MNKMIKRLTVFLMLVLMIALTAAPAYAVGGLDDILGTASSALANASASGNKALAAGLAIGLSAAAGAIGMGIAIANAVSGIARQPEAESKIRTALMLGLVFIETAIIYALIVAILIIFVL